MLFFWPLFCLFRLAAHFSFLVTADCPEWQSSAWAAEDTDNPELVLMNLCRRLSVKMLCLFILLQNFHELSPLLIRWNGSINSLVKCKNKKGELSRQAVNSVLCLWLRFMWECTVMQTTDPTAYFVTHGGAFSLLVPSTIWRTQSVLIQDNGPIRLCNVHNVTQGLRNPRNPIQPVTSLIQTVILH